MSGPIRRIETLFIDAYAQACVAGYYWDSVYFEQNKDGECSESPCTRACVDCDDVDPDGGNAVSL